MSNRKITITGDDAEFLLALSKEMNSQNNRGTSEVMFAVQEKQRVYNEGGDEWERIEDIEREHLCEECTKAYEDGATLSDYCADCDSDGFHKYNLEDVFAIGGEAVFFTAKACDEYIERRSYNYSGGRSYGISAYHNNEMKRVLKILSSLETGTPSKNYK